MDQYTDGYQRTQPSRAQPLPEGLEYRQALGGAQYQQSEARLVPKLLSASCTVREGEDDPYTHPCLPSHPEVLPTIRGL